MKRIPWILVTLILAASVAVAGCSQPAPAPTQAPAAPKPAEPTKAAAPAPTAAPAATKPAEPTKAAAPAPTAAPAAKKVDWPQKGRSITFIVNWPAGGPIDAHGRLLASQMEKELGVPVTVVNRGGADGQIGLTEAMTSKNDGYTTCIATFPTAIMTYLDPARKAAYVNGSKSFTPVASYASDPVGIGVATESPFKDIKDLIDAAKAKPGEIKFGTTGAQTIGGIQVRLLEQAAGVKFNLIGLDGAAGAITAVLGGHTDVTTLSRSILIPNVKSGKMRVLGVADPKESPILPGVKTIEAQGYKIYLSSFSGIVVAPNTPKEVVDVMADSIKKSLANADVKTRMDTLALDQVYLGPDEYTKYWNEQEAVVKNILPLLQLEKK